MRTKWSFGFKDELIRICGLEVTDSMNHALVLTRICTVIIAKSSVPVSCYRIYQLGFYLSYSYFSP